MMNFLPTTNSAAHLLLTPFQIALARERAYANLPAVPVSGQHYRTRKEGSIWRTRVIA